jgi:hypothetical protein
VEEIMKPTTAAAFLCVALAFFALGTRAAAQQGVFGSITGTITDSSGGVLSGATVNITNVATNVVKSTTTNQAGAYSVTNLVPGTYRVEASLSGFKTAVSSITLEVNANPKVDMALQVGAETENVTVVARAPLLQTEQTSLGQTVTQQQIEQLPTGRNLFNLIPLAAGISQQTTCDGCGNNGNLRINGDRPRNQDYILDGTTITAPVFGGQAFNPAVDTIQEFRIETNSMSAEYGKAGGGIIIAVTKSGTNSLRGSGYLYTRNEQLNARNYFEDRAQPKNPFEQNEFGGTLGGPILRDRLFFFSDYQGLRLDASTPVTGVLIPNSAFRAGDLSALCTTGFDSSGVCADARQQVRFPGTSVAVPFNRIPTAQISPIAQQFIRLWPAPAAPGRNPGTSEVSFTRPTENHLNRVNSRVDYQLSRADQVFGVFHSQWGNGVTYVGNIVEPASQQIARSDDHSVTLGWSRTFTSLLVNNFRFGHMHRVGHRGNPGQGATTPADFGLQGIPPCLSSVPDTANGTKCGTPGVSISGFAGFSTGAVLYEPASTLTVSDTLTTLRGRHSLKIGADARRYSIDNYQPNGVASSFNFTGSRTGDAFADFLFGTINNGHVQIQNAMVSTRAWSYSVFVQDDFKMSANLTLNLGLRWQYDQSFREIHDGLAFFNPFKAEWEQFGVNAPDTSFDPSKKQFAPRVGVAWNATPTVVIRAGYGLSYPSAVGHGRAGDGQPGPNVLARTNFAAGTNWQSLPPVTTPDPAAIRAPIPVTSNVSFSFWAPREQTPPHYHLWNLTAEKQLDAASMVQVAYVGNLGRNLPINYAYNICQQTQASTLLPAADTTSPYCPDAAAKVIAAGGSIYDLVVNPGYWGLSRSDYHALQAKYERRFSRGFSVLANFTWSKLMDDSSSDWGGFWSLDLLGQDFYDRKSERSVSAGDIPLRLTLASVVELPFGPGRRWLRDGAAGQIAGGWRATGIYTWSSGSPFGVTDNSYGFCNVSHTLTSRPNMIGDPLPSGFKQTVATWFDRNAFDFSGTCPAPGLLTPTGPGDPAKAFGNAPRYFADLRNPGTNTLNLSIQRDFRLGGDGARRFQFRADFYNALNHPQFAEPISDPGSANFGRITRTSLNNRTVQLGLHLYF